MLLRCGLLRGRGQQYKDSNDEPDIIKVPAVSPCGAYFGSPCMKSLRVYSLPTVVNAWKETGVAVTDANVGLLTADATATKLDATDVTDSARKDLPRCGIQFCCAFSGTAPLVASGCQRGVVSVCGPM
jgi:hypothetical protein